MRIELSHGDRAALHWFKSSYSPSDSNECVEVAWFKSSYSTADGPDCVEAAGSPGAVLVRDSKRPHRAHLSLSPTAWGAFLGHATRR
ncbi:DUF397 domain-containing protein [Streptomyces sp. NPDC048603]|uniref:DUF397 domain-containing protein n=1 Tax=Streptomyces sp. NPDC048603 TaxID=3365577 RepID=UPI00371FE840